MSDPRFKPPSSEVLATTKAGGPPLQMRGKLALLTLIQLGLMCAGALRMLFELTSVSVLYLMGFVALMAGLGCLYIGIALLVATRVRGRRFLSASVVLQVLSVVLWHDFYLGSWQPGSAATLLLPIVLGLVIAVSGRLVPHAWLAAMGETK